MAYLKNYNKTIYYNTLKNLIKEAYFTQGTCYPI